MDRKVIRVNITTGNTPMLAPAAQKMFGKVFSTQDRINANKIDDEYYILYTKKDIISIDAGRLVASMINIFRRNLPNSELEFIMDIIPTDPDAEYETLFESMTNIDKLFLQVTASGEFPGIYYNRGRSWATLLYEELESEDDEWGSDEEEEDDDDDQLDPFENIIDAYSKKSKNKDYYGRSRVFKNSKSPKKEFRRHGVIVAQNKSDTKKDRDTIKEFLKDFIPGGGWKKELRNEIADRWIQVYTVTKKQLKSLEHDARKHATDKRKSKATKNALRVTKKLFSVPIDRWSDPSK